MNALRPQIQKKDFSTAERLLNYAILNECEIEGAAMQLASLGEKVKDSEIQEAKKALAQVRKIQKNGRMYDPRWKD